MSAVLVMENGSVAVHARFDIPDYKFMREIVKIKSLGLRSVNEVVFTVVKSWIEEKRSEEDES